MKNYTTKQNSCQSFLSAKKKNPAETWFLVLIMGLFPLKGKGGLSLFHACPNARQMVGGTDVTGVNDSACVSFHAPALLKGPSPCGELRALNA
jgi:hypothetical protein